MDSRRHTVPQTMLPGRGERVSVVTIEKQVTAPTSSCSPHP